jgi:hypothetical protein
VQVGAIDSAFAAAEARVVAGNLRSGMVASAFVVEIRTT